MTSETPRAMDSAGRKVMLVLGVGLLCTLLVWVGLQVGFGIGGGRAPEATEEQASELTGSAPDELGAPQPTQRDAIRIEESEIPPGGRAEALLQGIVVTREGEPIAGAEVQVQRREGQGFAILEKEEDEELEIVARTHTASDGTFSFTVPPLRQFTLGAEAEGYGPELVFACYGGQFQRVVLGEAGAIEGLVTSAEDHSPLEGVGIWVIKANLIPALSEVVAWATMAEVKTDARGFYRVDGLPHTGLQVLVLPPQGIPPPTWLEVELTPGEVVRRDFTVELGGLLTGTVRDGSTGQPIAGAEVFDDPWSMRKVHTDELGQFALSGAEGAIRIQAKGYAQAVATVGSNRHLPRSVEVELNRGGAAEGRVIDASGGFLAGAYVSGIAHGDGMAGMRARRTTHTSSEGSFRIEDLNPGLSYYLLVRHPGFGTAFYDFPTQVQAGGSVEFGDVVLGEASAIRGRVVNQAEEAIPGVFVELTGMSGDFSQYRSGELDETERPSIDGATQSTTTDGDGAFRFGDLAPGDYKVTAKLGRSNRQAASIAIEDLGQVIDGVQIHFDTGLSISGSVRTPTGEVPREFIAMLHSGGSFKPYYDRKGTFEFGGLKEGTYTVTAQIWSARNEWATGVVSDVQAGATGVEVVFRPIAWIEGTVLSADGEPAPGMTVYGRGRYLGAESYTDRLRTGADGRFRMQVGEGDLVDIHAGPPRNEDPLSDTVPMTDPQREVVVRGISAGTEGLVIRLK